MNIKIILLLTINMNAYCEYFQPYKPYYSQGGQDKYLVEQIFKYKKNGVFFDIGAHDGISYSNTYYMEKFLDWSGICIEPQNSNFILLKQNRPLSKCYMGCVFNKDGIDEFIQVNGPSEMLSGLKSTYDPRHFERAKLEVSQLGGSIEYYDVATFKFNTICASNNISYIDLLTIDTEGSEEEIIRTIDFDNIKIYIIVVENNYDNNSIKDFLQTKGFKLIAKVGSDDIFLNNLMA